VVLIEHGGAGVVFFDEDFPASSSCRLSFPYSSDLPEQRRLEVYEAPEAPAISI